MNIVDLYYLEDDQIVEIVKHCNKEDLFIALLFQANVVQDRVEFALDGKIIERMKHFRTHPYPFPAGEIDRAISSVEKTMNEFLKL